MEYRPGGSLHDRRAERTRMTNEVAARTNPYPGLAPFEEKEASRFFGRDREVEEILDRMASRRLLAVIGVSGCGKSSLVRAGVIPILRLGVAANLPTHWRICTITPGNAPLKALRAAMNAPSGWPATSFDLVDQAKKNLQPGESLLLIVDQFEELFRFREETLAQDGGNQASLFVNLFLKAVEQREVPIYVMLTMRTDFLGKCAQFRGLPEALNDCYYLTPRMTRLQQQEAIERPLEEQSASMHAALVQRLLNDSAEDPDHLPVLQHLLKRLWENWNQRGVAEPIGMADYAAVGGWTNALNADAEGVFRQFEAEQEGLRRFFQWITERGTGERPIRRPRPFSECVEESGIDRARLGEIIRKFQGHGLLRPSDGSHQSLVDLPHESVMWQWSRLKRWIDDEAEQAAQLRFLLQSARQKNLLTGLALESASRWQRSLSVQRHTSLRYLNDEELAQTEKWIVRSAEFEQARRRRRRLLLGASGALVVTLAIVAVWVSRRQQASATAREISAWAAVSLPEDPERSLILGLHSWARQRAMVPGLGEILHSAVLQSPSRLTLSGHQDIVRSIAWSPDGRKLATASDDHTAKVWDATSGRELLSLRGHQNIVRSIAWSPDGSKLATASDDRTAKVWDATSGRELLSLRSHQAPVWSVAWSPDGSKLATASYDKTAKVWAASSGRELLALPGHQDIVSSIAWSPDGSKLATASYDKTAKVWAASSGRELLALRGHQDAVWSIAWSPDGSKLATASYDKTAKVWAASSGRELLALPGHQDIVSNIAWSPDGSKLATASYGKTAKVWEASSGRELLALRGHQDTVWSIAWSPDGSKLATASSDHTAKVWEASPICELLSLRGHRASVWSIAWSPDGSKLATASNDNTAKVWEAASGRELLSLHGHQSSVSSIAWSPDGSKLATASNDGTAKVWEAASGRQLLTLHGHQDIVRNIAWSPDGSKLATASDDSTVKVWEASSGRQLLALRGHPDTGWSIAWSPDGSKLAAASSDRTAMVWEAASGHELLTLRGHQDTVWSIAWSPDGSKLATASFDKTAKVWEATSGRELLTLHGHQDIVFNIAWSPDGSKLATASADNTAKVWEAASGRELLALRGHQGAVNSISWSPDGKRLASAGDDKIVQIYAIDQVELLRLVRSRITRDLTSDECRRYLNADRCPPLPDVP
ncbi:MAG: hypothetical protein LAP21_05020 [Acidobacteriia bacterium]|nr:hypothetical protein [Terriglobia bacterium]